MNGLADVICCSDMQDMGIRPHGVLQERHLIYWRRGSEAFEYKSRAVSRSGRVVHKYLLSLMYRRFFDPWSIKN